MKVFVAGATGVIGRVLVPQLVERGHDVVGMTSTPSKEDLVRSLGARPVVADALDPEAVGSCGATQHIAYDNSQLRFPHFLDAAGTREDAIDPADFYLIGTSATGITLGRLSVTP